MTEPKFGDVIGWTPRDYETVMFLGTNGRFWVGVTLRTKVGGKQLGFVQDDFFNTSWYTVEWPPEPEVR